jgi:pimeloyl-ACP methyl ester carboxylesterase
MKNVKKVLIWIGGLLVLYLGICLVLYFTQEKFAFKPKKLTSDYQFQFENKFEELFITAPDGIKLSGALFKADTSNGLIFFLHGSGGNIQRYKRSITKYLSLNYDIYLLDYRGYGKSEGRVMNEKQLYDDVRTAYSDMKSKYREEDIVIIGFSLGTIFGSMLASENNPQLLILEAPPYSLVESFKKKLPFLPIYLLSKYKFETYKYLKDVKVPIAIFHGSNDDFSKDLRLKQYLKPGDKFIVLEGEGHSDFALNNLYLNELKELIK